VGVIKGILVANLVIIEDFFTAGDGALLASSVFVTEH